MIKTPRLLLTPLTQNDIKNIHIKNFSPEVGEFNKIGIPIRI
jgi:hypothetical protein